MLVPVLGGIGVGTVAAFASQKYSTHPGLIAAGGALAGLAAMKLAKEPWQRQLGAGAAVGAAVFGAVPFVVSALQRGPQAQAQGKPQSSSNPRRGADGSGYVTREELNDALGKLADSHKETQKQQTCDLLTALRDEIKKVVAEGPNGPGSTTAGDTHGLGGPSSASPLPSKPPSPSFTSFFPRVNNDMRSAEGNEYVRNAYGDDIRDAEADEYVRNAYGDDIRDAEADEYIRNAYGDDIRDAYGDERDAAGYDERDAAGYDERDASGDERDASADERDAGADERDASADERDASSYDAEQYGNSAM
jgi:hypothetical protein